MDDDSKTSASPQATAYGIDITDTRTATQGKYLTNAHTAENMRLAAEVFGQLVQLGFDVAVFTPAAYRRRSLRRPSWSPHLVAGFALRCFQRLSRPDADTRRCTWRHNRQTGGLSTTVLSY